MAILDDVIGVFSPGWKAARLRSRAVIQAYEAVKTTRTHKARRENRTADQLSQYGAVSLREQARYLDNNHDLVIGVFDKLEEGNTNISGVTVVFRAGEQEQTPPEGFESSGSETVLGTEVKYDTPITRTITSANIDRLRFTFGVQALVETTSKGDRNPSEVRLLVQIQRNGGWVTEKDITIKGKTTS
ncbi:TipJ family phage tail tip protein, partial [Escherichia coli]|uniref:TipJ family phage tail tip protein n=1 Tax=Escherichia coli TaxID=562 RepID=UPI003D6A04C9